jgi:hypothetical protein
MNLPSLYIGLAIVVLILLPFIIGALRGQAKAKSITREFYETGIKYGIDISETETWNNRVMGLDVKSKKLLFRHTHNNELTETLIDLNTVSSCNSEINYMKSGADDKIIETIRLIFKMKPSKTTETISVYDADLDLNVYTEVQIAEKWVQHVNEMIS